MTEVSFLGTDWSDSNWLQLASSSGSIVEEHRVYIWIGGLHRTSD